MPQTAIPLSEGEINRVRQHLLAVIRVLNGRAPAFLIDRCINTLRWFQHRELERAKYPTDFQNQRFRGRSVYRELNHDRAPNHGKKL